MPLVYTLSDMDSLQALLQSAQLKTNNFPVTSRYHHIETAIYDTQDRESVVYLKRRFIPPPEHYYSTQQHKVNQGERPDTITAKYLGDPTQFWQLADANGLMKPQELTEATGKKLYIPQGTGLSGF